MVRKLYKDLGAILRVSTLKKEIFRSFLFMRKCMERLDGRTLSSDPKNSMHFVNVILNDSLLGITKSNFKSYNYQQSEAVDFPTDFNFAEY